MRALFAPRSVAVIGASPQANRPGGRALAVLRKFGFAGRVMPVNAKYAAIGDLPCYPDLAALPEPPEAVFVLVPAEAVPAALREAAAAGVRAAVVCTSGFGEAGPAGIALQQAVQRIAGEAGMAVLGPNCLGLVDLHSGFAASFSTAFDEAMAFRPGPVAFVSQSGATGAAAFVLAQREGIGIGSFVSTGNEAVIDFADVVDHLANDPAVSVILGYLEGVRDGRRFVASARRARAAGKALAILKVGQSDAGRAAARSHTGALAGSNAACMAAFRRGGVLAAADVQALLDLAVALPGSLPARGPRIGIVSASGGAGVMMADRATALGLDVPRLGPATQAALACVLPPIVGMANPVDYGPVYGDPSAIQRCVELVAADPGIDVVLFFLGLSPGMHGIIEHRLAAVQAASGKPVLAAWLGGPAAGIARLRELGIAGFGDAARCVEAAAHLVALGRPMPADPPGDATRAAETRRMLGQFIAAGRTQLTEREVKALVAAYGIPVVPEVLATHAAAAAEAGRRLARKLAVKAEAPALLHKSDAGAVRLNVAPEDAAAAFEAVVAAAAAVVGRDGVAGAVIQPMAAPGLELIVGGVHDADYGPTITVGLGGVFSEVMADVCTELAPVDPDIARDMLMRLRGARLLGPFRGAPPRDVAAMVSLLVQVGQFAADAGPLLAELDLNPVILHPDGQGCTVVDGAAILRPQETA